MKIVRGFTLGLAALAMVFLMTPSGAYANAATRPTVGDFLTSYAKALNIELPASASADALVTSLRASGVKLDAKVDAILAKIHEQGSESLTESERAVLAKASERYKNRP